jgi:release factor glutamine methyltransferase
MNWHEYIIKNTEKIIPVFGNDESIVILKKVAEYISKNQFYSIRENSVSNINLEKADNILLQLKDGTPLQYILGEAWFYKYSFKVNKSVLIPRPETEELIEWVLTYIQELSPEHKYLNILDIGTGSGCIPITLKKEMPELQITSIDVSTQALATAKENASLLDTNIEFRELNFLNEETWKELNMYDIIISNPPYIPANEKEKLSINVRNHEPGLALFVPENKPLLFYEKIATFGQSHVQNDGVIFLELHKDFAGETQKLYEEEGYKNVIIKKDISGNERILKANK